MKCFIALTVLSALVLSVLSQGPTKEAVLCTAEKLPNPSCRDAVINNANMAIGDPNNACNELESNRETMKIVGCDEAHYDILYKTVCLLEPCVPDYY